MNFKVKVTGEPAQVKIASDVRKNKRFIKKLGIENKTELKVL